jgi:hypothetical protein
LKASKIALEIADERARINEFKKNTVPVGGGKNGLGTFGDLLKKFSQ